MAAAIFASVVAYAAGADDRATDTDPPVPGSPPARLLLTASPMPEAAPIEVPRFREADIDFRLDGRLTEAVWGKTPGYDDMRVLIPDTLEVPKHRTVMRYFYTEKGLYVGMWAEQ
ncbi:MAG: hypothetical protein PVH91_12405, partial [Pseudomonadales bacterium]